MAFNIKDIKQHSLKSGTYLFDTNIWIYILFKIPSPGSYTEGYLTFFGDFRKSSEKPKIAITSQIVSEILNRYFRDIGFPKFCLQKGIDDCKENYKKHYKTSPEYIVDYGKICSDIDAYSEILIPVNDGLGTDFTLSDILCPPETQKLDYADRYYYLIAKKKGYMIVTDDADFFVEDVPILTLNAKLIKKAKDSIIPFKKEGINSLADIRATLPDKSKKS